FLKPVLDKTLLRILGGLAGVYLILFLFLSFGSIEEKEKTLEDVPKHLKKVLYNAGIEQARKIQEAAIGQIAQNLEGGRARLEEGKASSSKVAEQKKKSTKPEKTKSPPQKVAQEKTSAPKVAEKATPPK